MAPIRVLMVVRLFYPWIGGTEVQAHKLSKKLLEKGVSVEIVTGWWFLRTPQCEVIDEIPIFRNHTLWEFFGIKGLRKFGGYLYILSLLWYLWRQRANYDLLHVHGLNYHTFAAVLAGRWFKRRTLTKLANSGRASDIKKMRQNEQLALAQHMLSTALKSDRFAAVNTTVVQELVAAGVSRQRIVELSNGVETEGIETKSCYDLHSPARLIFVGRLHKQKDLAVLLKAFQHLIDERAGHSVRLLLIGEGPLRDDLNCLAKQLGISKFVEFLGQTDLVFEQLQQADIFVLPSRAEGLSNALLEAMAFGLPVIVSNVPGNVDVVKHKKNGLIFETGDHDALTRSLDSLLKDTALRQRLGNGARHTIETQYSLNKVADRYISIYEEMLSGKADSQ